MNRSIPPGRGDVEFAVSRAREARSRVGGRPFEQRLRQEFGWRLGHNFADVRVYEATDTLRSVGASAYTVGRDILFAPGRYEPGKPAGRRLLAHELAHVVQQSGAPAGTNTSDEDLAEHEARAAAEADLAGRPFVPRLRTPIRVARQAEEAAPALERPVSSLAPAVEAAAAPASALAEAARFRSEQLDFARDRIEATTGAIGIRLAELRAKPEAERPPLQAKVHGLERELVAALADRVGLLERHLPELEQRQAAGEDVKGELERSRRELAEHREDLARLGGVFSPEKGAAFKETYQTKVAGLNCMQAAYAGLGTLRTPAESAEIERKVEKKAEQGMKRKKPVDLNQFITVMETARAEKVAGPRLRARWNRKTRTWTPTLERIVRGKIHPVVPGFYFFGLALAEAFHSVLIGVSTWDQPSRTLWCDQHGCTEVPGLLDAHALAALDKWRASGLLTYGDWDSDLWPVRPPAAASLLAPALPGEAT